MLPLEWQSSTRVCEQNKIQHFGNGSRLHDQQLNMVP